MSVGGFLFSFRGRVNRARYWLFHVGAVGALVLWFLLVALVVKPPAGRERTLWVIASLLLYLPVVYAGAAVTAKRLHDRGKSAFWLLIFWLAPGVLRAVIAGLGHGPGAFLFRLPLSLAAFAIGIWQFVELGCLRGTVGPNLYGSDPLERGTFAGFPPPAAPAASAAAWHGPRVREGAGRRRFGTRER